MTIVVVLDSGAVGFPRPSGLPARISFTDLSLRTDGPMRSERRRTCPQRNCVAAVPAPATTAVAEQAAARCQDLAPEEAADRAERDYRSTRPPDWIKRRR